MKKGMAWLRLFNNMLAKVAKYSTQIAVAIVLFVLSFLSVGEGAAMPYAMPVIPADVDTTAYHSYPYVRFVTDQDSMKMSDEEFFDIAGKVIFPINKWTLPKRDSLIMQLENEVFPLINRDSLELVHLMLRGAASPEGPTRWNKILGERRAETMLNFIKSNLTAPIDENFEVEIDIEDFRTLCLLMRRMGDKDYGYVQAMCDQYLPKNQLDKLKSTLRNARQGTLWLRLFREYFPRLRAARIVFFFRTPRTLASKVLPETPVEGVKTPEQTDVSEDTGQPDVTDVPVTPDASKDSLFVTLPTDREPRIPVERYPRREMLSIKTNLLFYGFYMPGGYNRWCPIPNVALEYYPLHGHFTYGASFDCPWWRSYHQQKFFQVRNYQLETRYYFRRGDIELRPEGKGAAFKGLYLQAYGNVTVFGICLNKDKGWEGEGFGAGLGVGYVMPLSKKGHWRLEFQLQAGFLYGGYDPYKYESPFEQDPHDDRYYYRYYGDPSFFKKRQHRFSWIGPTRIGVTLSYDLLYRKALNKTNGENCSEEKDPTWFYNPLVPYERDVKGGRP